MMFFACFTLGIFCGIAASILEPRYLSKAKNTLPALLLACVGCIVSFILSMFFAFQFLGATL